MTRRPYVPRLIDGTLDELLAGLPAVLLVGPRGAGKTTTALRRGASILRLDRPAEAAAVEADPDAVLRTLDEPVVIDEWQLVPEILGALKRTIDEDPRPGRFLLTGSAAAELSAVGWPATGRVVRVELWGLTERELSGDPAAALFLTRLIRGEAGDIGAPVRAPSLHDYTETSLRGAFPEVAFQSNERLRRSWLTSYVNQLVSRDVSLAGPPRDPVRLHRYLEALAANTSGVVEHKTLYDAAGVNRLTAVAYDAVLQATFVVEHVAAWKASRLGRLVATPKRYLSDPALTVPLLGLNARAVMRDGDLLGRILDTFVAAQLRAELPASAEALRLFHLREPHGRHEVDLVVEASDGRVAGIEVKASASPDATMARHLAWLRDRLGDRFVGGVVLHTGPRPFPLGDRLHALPICSIWE